MSDSEMHLHNSIPLEDGRSPRPTGSPLAKQPIPYIQHRKFWIRTALIGIILIVAVIALGAVIGSVVFGDGSQVHQVTVASLVGTAEVAEDGAWNTLRVGDRLKVGKRLRTGPDSSMTLAYFEGTRTTLDSETEIALTTLDGAADTLRVVLTQRSGRTSHTVVPLRGEDGFFVVDTPGGQASVLGTVFDVLVDQNGQAEFFVERGKVRVSGSGEEVLLLAGESTSSLPGETPKPLVEGDCTYGQGFWKNHPEEWPVESLTLGGVSYSQEELLAMLNTPPQGDATYILVRQYVAALLNVLAGADSSAVDAALAAADAWLVANPPGSDPQGEDRQEGIDLAEELEAYNSGLTGPGSCDDEEPEATTTLSSTLTSTMTSTMTLSPTLGFTDVVTDCTGANPHPHATTLADSYGVTYDEIMGWKCSGFGFGEIEHAYDLSIETGEPVEDIFAMRISGYGWGRIRKMLREGGAEDGDLSGDDFGPGNSPGKKDKSQGQGNGQGQGQGPPGQGNGKSNGNVGQGPPGQGKKDK